MISTQILRSVAKTGAVLMLIVLAAALFGGHSLWAAAALTGASWAYVNFYFLFRLLEIAMSFDTAPGRMKNRILLWSLLKFPVLYIAGFFILKCRLFPVSGILTGLTVIFGALVFSWGSFYRGSSAPGERA